MATKGKLAKVVELVYWKNMGKTGVVFTGLVVGLASLFQLSALTVLSYLGLGILCVTFPLRFYYKLLELLRWNPEKEQPFQTYLDEDSSLTNEDTVVLVEKAVLLIAFALTELKRLLFIGSITDSVKFAVLLYLLSHVGILTNGLTLVIAGVICLFSFPLLYKKQQGRIKRLVRAVKGFLRRIKNMFKRMYRKIRPVSVPAPDSDPAPALAPVPAPAPKPKSK
ncbi:reticulon-2b isoform X1 [Hypomesus transpacificus]|uniref:reticulon-2b isoform X1 n=1 Tax=Hypomesus transpacificus TaxID=137520 RepID=UPI001F081127|nr:reticulon-2b isoform X1 [Hypomesus transpacificus]